jgi:hypothetical protein
LVGGLFDEDIDAKTEPGEANELQQMQLSRLFRGKVQKFELFRRTIASLLKEFIPDIIIRVRQRRGRYAFDFAAGPSGSSGRSIATNVRYASDYPSKPIPPYHPMFCRDL